MRQKSLDAIGLDFGTDKSSNHHDYLAAYDEILHPLRASPIRLLEIGVLDGASLAMWEAYFPAATIIGADINPAVARFARDRVHIEILDQSDPAQLRAIAERHGPFDVIIEDGSHVWRHQITSLVTLFPLLRNGGFYVVEDLQTNYGKLGDSYRGDAERSCMALLKNAVDMLVGDDDAVRDPEPEPARLAAALHSVSFIRHACILRKSERGAAPPDRAIATAVEAPAGERLLPDPVGGVLPVRLTLHLSDKGDVTADDGCVNFAGDRHQAEGLAIDAAPVRLEARVGWSDGTGSAWTAMPAFLGSRGIARRLHLVSVRLAADEPTGLSLRVAGRFAGQRRTVEVGPGEECRSPMGGALCGLQVTLVRA